MSLYGGLGYRAVDVTLKYRDRSVPSVAFRRTFVAVRNPLPLKMETLMRQILSSILFFCVLVLPLSAQEEALHGTWEMSFVDEEGNAITMSLTFQEDGAFELNQVIELGEGFQSAVEAAEIPVEEITVQGRGTYQVAGDSLLVDIAEEEMLVGGRDFFEVLEEVARALARVAADLLGISEADYPAFEQVAVDEFLAGMDEEEFLAGFSGEEVAWAIEGDTLFITTTTEEGVETLEFQRIDPSSAVAQTTWGGLKAAGRP